MDRNDQTPRTDSQQPTKREWQTPRLEREGKVVEVTLVASIVP